MSEQERNAWLASRLARLRDGWEHGQFSWRQMLNFYRCILEEFGERP